MVNIICFSLTLPLSTSPEGKEKWSPASALRVFLSLLLCPPLLKLLFSQGTSQTFCRWGQVRSSKPSVPRLTAWASEP